MEANIILMKCKECGQTFGVRIQRMDDGDWYRTWAFPIKDTIANHEGFDRTPIRGNLYYTEGFPGCPYCGSYGFVQCGNCRKLCCYNNESRITCRWCGQTLENIVENQDQFDVSGGDY